MADSRPGIQVSVVIPTADRQDFLLRSVDSVLHQSCPPGEVIVVDNGEQPIADLCFSALVRIIRTQPRIGCSRARNEGANQCKYPYVAFLDDDDYWEIDYLENMLHCIRSTGADCVVGQVKRLDNDGEIRTFKCLPESRNLQRRVYFSNPGFSGSNFVIRKALFTQLGQFNEEMPTSEDRDLLAKLIKSNCRLLCEPKAVTVADKHDGPRASHDLRKGNWMFIKQHWKDMTLSERYRALWVLCKRSLSASFQAAPLTR